MLLALTAMAPPAAGPAQQPEAGEEAFDAALTVWLDDSDRDSLPVLSGLARSGDDDARQFLRLLELRPDLWTPWLNGRSQKQRAEFFRPGLPDAAGPDGWWRGREIPEPVRLLVSQPLEEPFVQDMLRLIEVGEPRLAFARLAGALQFKPLSETRGLGEHAALPVQLSFLRVLSDFIRAGAIADPDVEGAGSEVSSETRMQKALYFSWAMFLMVDGDYGHEIPTETMREVITVLIRIAGDLPYITAEAALADPEVSAKSAWPDRRGRTLDWLMQSDEAGHYRAMCTEQCGDEFDRCLLASYFANGGHAVLYARQTPSERYIPAARFAASRRGAMLPIRRVAYETLSLGTGAGAFLAGLRTGSACYLKQVAAEMRRLEKGQ